MIAWNRFDHTAPTVTGPADTTGESPYWVVEDRRPARSTIAYFTDSGWMLADGSDDASISWWAEIEYPAPPAEENAGYRRTPTDDARGAAADVAGAVANLIRATDPTDPRYDAFREAYGLALEAAGLVPEETRPRMRG